MRCRALGYALLVPLLAASQPADVREMVRAQSQSPLLRHAQWSVLARFVDDDSTIVALNPEQALAPASCLKLVTTAAALDILGEDFRFETKLVHDGRVDAQGALKGNVYIVGGGDPTLGSTLVPGSMGYDSLLFVWSSALRSIGISHIEGSVLADDFLFDRIPIPDLWYWIDIGNYYATSTSALTINDNLYRVFFAPGTVGEPARLLRTEPDVPGLSFVNAMRTGKVGSGDNGYVYCAPGQMNAVVRGTVPAGVDEFDIKGSIPNPPLFAAQSLTRMLGAMGVTCSGTPGVLPAPRSYAGNRVISSVLSPPLSAIVTVINKKSFNLYAEQVAKMLGRRVSGEGSTEAGMRALAEFLGRLGVPTQGAMLYDGSGLSRSDAISAETMVQMLSRMTRTPHWPSYYASFSVAADPGDIGFFRSFGTDTPIAMNARVKSGAIQGVRSHAGYLRDRAGRLIAFCCIANNYAAGEGNVDRVDRDILIALAELR